MDNNIINLKNKLKMILLHSKILSDDKKEDFLLMIPHLKETETQNLIEYFEQSEKDLDSYQVKYKNNQEKIFDIYLHNLESKIDFAKTKLSKHLEKKEKDESIKLHQKFLKRIQKI